MSSFYDKAAGLPEGHSSYFESPHASLDPSLFDGDHLKPAVREHLVARLEDALRSQLDLSGVSEWLHAWLAGSGITYQWEGGEGDLDVLFGVDMARFYHWNPDFTGIPERDIADWADTELKANVWPANADTKFGRRAYEVTFYWNPGTGTDITRIRPYAAYDLLRDLWAVTPPSLPHDPQSLYPAEWFQAAQRDVAAAGQLIARHDSRARYAASSAPGTPDYVNAQADLGRVRDTVRAHFDDIHLGRRAAFGDFGKGYSDWANFRWQHAKAEGVIKGYRAILEDAKKDSDAADQEKYGGPIDGAQTILTRDMLRYGKHPYL